MLGHTIKVVRGVAVTGLIVSFFMQPVSALEDDAVYYQFRADRFEYGATDENDMLFWDARGWIGNDDHKVAFKSEGERVVHGKLENAELALLYQRPIARFFDVQAGLRHDFRPRPTRTFGVVGLRGLAPYWFEVDANLYLSEKGDLSARLEAEYELLLTQRLIFEPAVELNVAFTDDEPTGVGSGFNQLELGFRLRYEIRREFAPYIGIHWERRFGETADLARQEGEDVDNLFLVAGLRFWF